MQPCAPPLMGLRCRPCMGPVGAPPAFVRLRVRKSQPCAPLLSLAPLLYALFVDVPLPPPVLLLPRLRCRPCLSSRVFPRP